MKNNESGALPGSFLKRPSIFQCLQLPPSTLPASTRSLVATWALSSVSRCEDVPPAVKVETLEHGNKARLEGPVGNVPGHSKDVVVQDCGLTQWEPQ